MPTDSSAPNLLQLREQMQDILAPVHAQAAAVETAIAEKAAELEELRAVRRDIARLLNAANPGAKPGPPKKRNRPGGRSQNGRYPVSDAKLEAVIEFVKKHLADQETFRGPDIFKHPDWNEASHATVTKALDILADRHVIRLDHIGKDRSKNYKLVNRGQE